MDFLQLQYFQKIAELQHMTRAAEELHISQPALSKVIKNLEREMGVSFFDRKGKRIVLNEAGRIMRQYTDVALEAMEQARSELDEYQKTNNATVTISIRIAQELLIEALTEFRKQYPSVTFKTQLGNNLQDSIDDQCDITYYSGMTYESTENVATLMEEPICLAVSENHPLAMREEVSLGELKNENFIACIPMDSTINKTNNLYCEMAGFHPKIIVEAATSTAVCMMVSSGTGVAMVPQISWIGQTKYINGIKLLKIVNPDCKRYILIRWKSKGYFSKAAVLFRDFLIEYFKEVGNGEREE